MRTSYFQNPRLVNAVGLITVRISLGKPRWGVRPAFELPILEPTREMIQTGYAELDYVRLLEQRGRDAVREQVKTLQAEIRPFEAILLCFESLKKTGSWCHRRYFAAWWQQFSGEEVLEF